MEEELEQLTLRSIYINRFPTEAIDVFVTLVKLDYQKLLLDGRSIFDLVEKSDNYLFNQEDIAYAIVEKYENYLNRSEFLLHLRIDDFILKNQENPIK